MSAKAYVSRMQYLCVRLYSAYIVSNIVTLLSVSFRVSFYCFLHIISIFSQFAEVH